MIVTSSEINSFVFYMACGGMIFIKKSSNFRKKNHFVLLHSNFSYSYCSIKLKRQSEHSRLRPDTSSLVYFCSCFRRFYDKMHIKYEENVSSQFVSLFTMPSFIRSFPRPHPHFKFSSCSIVLRVIMAESVMLRCMDEKKCFH